MGGKLLFKPPWPWSRDQCSAKREKLFHFLVGLEFAIGLGLGYDSDYWLVLGFGVGLEFGSYLKSGHRPGLQK